MNKNNLTVLIAFIILFAGFLLLNKLNINGLDNLARPLEKVEKLKVLDKGNLKDCSRVPGPCGLVVEVGEYFSCAVIDNSVQCWGDNRSGQLGNGNTGGFIATPQNVVGLSGDVVDVAVGNLHACAILSTRKVECWGENNTGQIGNGTVGGFVTSPTQVSGLTDVATITAGLNHTCALMFTGQMKCWGENKYGQLGVGTTTPSTTPVALSLVGVTKISAGVQHTCAVVGTQAYCWGWNDYGQVGNGTTGGNVLNPNPVLSLSNVISISAGNTSSCAVRLNGLVVCWGQNQYGQLGNGTTTSSSIPVSTGITNGTQVTVGDGHSCTVILTGGIKCWGWNKFGQLGNGMPPSSINLTPQNVINIANAVQVSVKFSHTCVVNKTITPNNDPANILCFGQGYNGALGNGLVNNSNIPVFAIQNHKCCWEKLPTTEKIRNYHTSIWTGTEMIVWGGMANNILMGDGERYNRITNTWSSVSMAGAPSPRINHSAVWTGTEMIIWGGENPAGNSLGDGFRYNPVTNTWNPISNIGAPLHRFSHTVIWTGAPLNKMIIWGGASFGANVRLNTGAMYDPNTDTWTTLPLPTLQEVHLHSAVWTGTEMIIWGGNVLSGGTQEGAKYNPLTNTWTPISTINAPVGRERHSAVWTGTEMIIWGGHDVWNNINGFNDGGKYNPVTNTWTAISAINTPMGVATHSAVWTGTEMIIWGGAGIFGPILGKSYNPISNIWSDICTINEPSDLNSEPAYSIWTGTEMIVWGAPYGGSSIPIGGIYTP